MSEDLATWLRGTIESDLGMWRAREEAHLAGGRRGREEALTEAREQIARCEAGLAVLDFHDLAETWERAEGKPLKQAEVLRIVARQLGHGYRLRDGYDAWAWKP